LDHLDHKETPDNLESRVMLGLLDLQDFKELQVIKGL